MTEEGTAKYVRKRRELANIQELEKELKEYKSHYLDGCAS